MVATDPPDQPMNYDHDDLLPFCSSIIDSTYVSSSSEVKSSHLFTPPHQSSRIGHHAPERLGYSPGKFGKSYDMHATLHSIDVPTSYSQYSTKTC